MKKLFRSTLRRLGFELLHRDDDPILTELRELHETLRLEPHNRVLWDDSLPQPAAHACLRNLIQLHGIDLVLDVGANRGQFAHLVRRIGYSGEIVSFEPLARCQSELCAAAATDGHRKIVPVALGSASAELDLHVYNDDTFSSLHIINATGHNRFQELAVETKTEHVIVRKLDDFWPELCGKAKRRVLLKTDTQGHDLSVLVGATETLLSTYAVITEAAFQPIYIGSPLFAEIAAWLDARGFVVSGLFPISHRPEDLALIELDAFFTRLDA